MAREDGIHKIETHVAGLCFSKHSGTWQCLVACRTSSRSLFPNKWECGGGQVHECESFEEALTRQMHEEFGIKIEILAPLATYCIRSKDHVIPSLAFLCSLRDGQTITLDPSEHTESKWITENEIDQYDLILGVKDNLRQAFDKIKTE